MSAPAEMGVPLMSGITLYDVLGVLPDAPLEDIRAAWQEREA